ncbi:hypothetical protein ACMY46_03805 [Bartonella bacilliformis]|uniref:hypothetical protein n=1 Tax=Bartonella bacilliformis TaxID=774 RepID=UPI00049F08B3|nr:hypothetical protein H705_00479 [Bartonella bacilliformis Cond044]
MWVIFFAKTHLIIIFNYPRAFWRGKVSELMCDIADGIKAFKNKMKEEEEGIKNEFKMADHSETIDINLNQYR